MQIILMAGSVLLSNSAAASDKPEVCFTPGQDCTGELVQTIGGAKQSILVQAYSFTSKPIAEALVDAKHKGVDVKVILDKSQINLEKSVAT